MEAVAVYLGTRTLRELDNTYSASVPAHIVTETDLERGQSVFAHFDRREQAIVYRTTEQNPVNGSGPDGAVFLGSYQLWELDGDNLGLTVPREIVVHTDVQIGDDLGVHWDPADRSLCYHLEPDPNPFSRSG
ncbi:hypothetical protein [Halopiger thermotolerans]